MLLRTETRMVLTMNGMVRNFTTAIWCQIVVQHQQQRTQPFLRDIGGAAFLTRLRLLA
jgi:hypothetical protein